MRTFRFVLSTLALIFVFNVVNAQTIENESVGLVSSDSESTTSLTETEAHLESVKVWPQVSSVKIMVDVENLQEVNIYSCTGRLVKTQKVDKGQGINIETLMPGNYTVKVGNKVGTFTKK